MRQNWLCLMVLVALLAALGGCAQQTAPTQPLYPKPSPVFTSPSTQPPTSNLSPIRQALRSESGQGEPLTSQNAAWDNVVKAGKKEGTVVFYSVTYVGTDAESLGKAFYQQYGIKVDFISGAGGSHGERLNVEKRMGQITGDVVQGSPARLFQMKMDGVLETSKDLPVIQNKALWEVDPLLIDTDGHLPIFASNWSGPLINTRLVPPGEEPRSLKDLLQPKWKGKILSPDPRVFSALSVSYATFQRRGLIDWSYVEALGKQDLG